MHIDFKRNGYLVAREFFDNTTVALMQTYWNLKWRFLNFSDEGKQSFEHSKINGDVPTISDADVAFSYNIYGDPLTESIELCYGQLASELLETNLSPTYTYTRIYEKDSFLIPHIDRESCEVSATSPIIISDDKPSKIFISNFKWWEVTDTKKRFNIEEIKQKGDYSEVELYPGDVLFYSGLERYHWREPLESDYMIQFFMHFVLADGEYKDLVFDRRPYMGFPDGYKGLINN